MSYKRKISGGTLSVVGFLLSPLSWWNNLFINFPIAYAGAWVVSLVYKPAFLGAFIFVYWVTNVVGFILMHKGVKKIIAKDDSKQKYLKKELYKDILISILYTILIVVLVKLGIIQPMEDYFN